MRDYYDQTYIRDDSYQRKKQKKNKYLLHLGLFLITFLTTTIAGLEWVSGSYELYQLSDLAKGLPYAVSIMFIISCHEFGHFFAARYHKVDATLPYYIPFPSILGFLNFGTMGAVIRTRSPIHTKKAMFDIGAAGPLAGFVACIIVLVYGFLNVPGVDYLLKIHPDFYSPEYGKNAFGLTFGDTLLFSFFKSTFVSKGQFFPPMSEVYHYPYLCVGWFGLFITAMNMIPIGQLDGGHIGYTIFGEKNHFKIAAIFFVFLVVSGVIGFIDNLMELNWNIGWPGWLFWAAILFFIIKLKHPPIPDDSELDPSRKFLGYLTFFIFVISFSPVPFVFSIGG